MNIIVLAGLVLAGGWVCPAPAQKAAETPEAGVLAADRPVPVTRAVDAKPRKPDRRYPLEGSSVGPRRARIELHKATGWCLVRFENSPKLPYLPPAWALPCRLLAKMEDLAAKDPKIVFEVSCENTIYEDKYFVLMRGVRVAGKPAQARPAPATQPARAATSRPAKAAAATRPAPEATSEDIMRELRSQRRGKTIVVDRRRATTGAEPAVAPATAARPKAAVMEHKTRMIVDRTVTMLPAGRGRWKEVRFRTDNNLADPPLLLLPCGMLTKAEATKGLMRITGEVTAYRGKQYLLLRKAIVERPLGRF